MKVGPSIGGALVVYSGKGIVAVLLSVPAGVLFSTALGESAILVLLGISLCASGWRAVAAKVELNGSELKVRNSFKSYKFDLSRVVRVDGLAVSNFPPRLRVTVDVGSDGSDAFAVFLDATARLRRKSRQRVWNTVYTAIGPRPHDVESYVGGW